MFSEPITALSFLTCKAKHATRKFFEIPSFSEILPTSLGEDNPSIVEHLMLRHHKTALRNVLAQLTYFLGIQENISYVSIYLLYFLVSAFDTYGVVAFKLELNNVSHWCHKGVKYNNNKNKRKIQGDKVASAYSSYLKAHGDQFVFH